jgi:hypothetical protein
MTETGIRGRELQELLEGTRKVLRRSEELIQQTEKLVKQSRELMRDFHFPHPNRTLKKSPDS